MKHILRVAVLGIALASIAATGAFAQDVPRIIAELDRLGDFSGSDFAAIYTIVSQKPGEKDSVSQVRMFRRDDKKQFTLLVILPEVNKGQGYLREDDNVWFYDPTSRKFSFSSIKENIQNSEAKNSDLVRKSILEDYQVVGSKEGMLGKIAVWIIDLKARTNDVSYERVVMHVRKDKTMLLKEEDFSVSGRLMRTTLFPKYVEISGRLMPSQILIIDELNPGERSQMTMTEQSLAGLPDKVFTKAFLEQVNK
ncbi:MAG: outer membrane lipoprotein-sorting protein [Spirochaetae bacterium HGW-Spirochaetae-7]|jgi:outer membrane lipoprotein-sorting protein|nr:MAG: outer membrane lipoprotein-sorting protein [Spirochaetae bacterium HGW-Spirochaetae-7]